MGLYSLVLQGKTNNLSPLQNESIDSKSHEIVDPNPIPFGSIVLFILKLFISLIPLFFIAAVIFSIVYAIFKGLH